MKIKRGLNIFRPGPLSLFIASVLAAMAVKPAVARDYFNPGFLNLGNPASTQVDLSGFEQGEQAPGSYNVDIIVNDQMVATDNVDFYLTGKGEEGHLVPCLSVQQLKNLGVKTALFPQLRASGHCADLSVIPQASADFQFHSHKLLLSIPQAAIDRVARGYVSPDRWDEGISALMLNYSVSGANYYSRQSNESDSNNQYANLRPGVNIGPWRLRNYSTWNRDSQSGQDSWDTVYTYAQRNIIALKSQLTLGDSSSPSDVFDSLPFRGVQLASDDDMLPDSLRGYAPVVRGIARTNAQVIIRQNGYQIYESFVAPGAFEITDMYPTGGSGDLYVTIKEADGSEQNMVVPYASLPVLQREGRLKYAATGGEYRSYDGSVEKTAFGQLTGIYGLPWGVTLYGGVQGSNPYQSVSLGFGHNIGDYGALSTDVTHAKSSPKDTDSSQGQSWRVRYSKNFVQTGTNLAVAGYRYSTNGYYGMQEVLDSYGNSSALQDRRRNRAELTLSQNLWQNGGALALSIIKEDYWNSGKAMESWSMSYNNSWQGVSFGVNYTWSNNTYAQDNDGGKTYDHDRVIALNISVPLDRLLKNTWANYSLSNSQKGRTTQTLGLSGTALADHNLSWGIQQGYGSGGQGNNGALNADYKGTYGEAAAGYSYDSYSQRVNYGASGSVIAHRDGITFGQALGETVALVDVAGASGIGVDGQSGVKTDWRGYTVAPNVMPYRQNDISLNTATYGDNVDLDLTTASVVPTRGAVVRASYKARIGSRMLLTLRQPDGKFVPFGATVSDKGSSDGFIVGEEGQVYVTGVADNSVLLAKWGPEGRQQCSVAMSSLPKQASGLVMAEKQCGN